MERPLPICASLPLSKTSTCGTRSHFLSHPSERKGKVRGNAPRPRAAPPSSSSLRVTPVWRDRFVSKPDAGGSDLPLRSMSPAAAAGTGDRLGASGAQGCPGALGKSQRDVPARC